VSELRKELGKISSIYFGLGGYQDACIGLNVSLSFNSSGVNDNKTAWDKNIIKCDDHCKWTEKDRSDQYAEIVSYVSDLLSQANKRKVEDLVGTPVEVMFDGMQLKSWRILTEVI